jgi:transcriptional regulator with XRE-family HTH domain
LDLKDIGGRIKAVRKILDIKQTDVSKAINISVPTISDYETGKKKPNFNFLLKFASSYNVSLDYLVLGKGDPFPRKGLEFDDFWKDNPFGDSTNDIKEILSYIQRSRVVRNAIIAYAWEYIYRNEEFIESDIRKTEIQKRQGEVKK